MLRQLKHPQEVQTLREIYGPGFFLLGATASMESRKKYLVKNMGMSEDDAIELIERDTEEDKKEFGQRTRNTFELADAFVSVDEGDSQEQVWRILDLIFGCAFHTPTCDEFGMFMAYAASLRSADLSRQVGAVVMTSHGEILATGANDVPALGEGSTGQASCSAVKVSTTTRLNATSSAASTRTQPSATRSSTGSRMTSFRTPRAIRQEPCERDFRSPYAPAS